MKTDEKIEIEKSRTYQVVKSNDLILKTRYDYTVNEQKTLAYICSMIKPVSIKDKMNKSSFILEYEFQIIDYIKILGVENNGRVYNEIKSILKGLVTKVMWLKLDDSTETTVNWIQKVYTNKKSGKVKIRLDEDLIPYLFDLREKYLSYGLINILAMKSQYSIHLYEMMKSYHDFKIGQKYRKEKEENEKNKSIIWEFDIDEIKKQLMVHEIKSYQNYKDFRKYVLEIAQKEINELTDINIEFEPIKKGRKVVKLRFEISKKNTLDCSISSALVSEKL